jgi:hypothetical protein
VFFVCAGQLVLFGTQLIKVKANETKINPAIPKMYLLILNLVKSVSYNITLI